MKVLSYPPKNSQIHAYLLFFFICNVQIGIGIFSFQRYVFQIAKHDAWISVIIACLYAHVLLWLIVRMLSKYESTDLYGIHFDMFGKYIGTLFNCIYMLYYLFVTILIMRSYVVVVQVWMFPDMSSWLIGLLLVSLTIYAGFGGIRVIVGMCLLGFVVILITVFFCLATLKYAIWTQLLPVMESSVMDILKGSFRMSFTLAGFEFIMLIYPYVRNKERTMLHSQLSLLFGNVVYLSIMILSLVYFSSSQLIRSIWPTFNMLKILKFPFTERLEFIVISMWMLMVLTGILINTWAITRGFKRMWNSNQKVMLLVVIFLAFGVTVMMEGRKNIERLSHLIGGSSAVLSLLYPLLLSLIVMIVFKVRERKRTSKGGDTS
ncbi:GerAB/ArcD/ProY family transporter [Paenibacillus sp. GCM10028914]|uniref:GerAB/ArcD/ProY family transporter n=1 Tax=Paenibacillus sp. GCM10028914 TaxID=3273416 RepID=UPI003610A6F1